MYNHLVALRNRSKNAYAQIDVQLKRRYDLIPNLVETARNQAADANRRVSNDPSNATTMTSLVTAESALSGALGRLMIVSESYLELKANQTMSQVMEELGSTENRISFARQAFNDSVTEYNISREKFPNSVIATACDFKAAALFQIDNHHETITPKVSFS